MVVLCLDVGPSMSLTPLDGGETSLEKALRVARQITQQKVWGKPLSSPYMIKHVRIVQMFAGSKDLLGLVLFGTPGNPIHTDSELPLTSIPEMRPPLYSGPLQNVPKPMQDQNDIDWCEDG